MADPNGPPVTDLTVEEVKAGMDDGTILLVDVREPNELAAESIPGAIDFPLSTFDPAALPDPEGKRLVFSCRSGLAYDAHMAGGILAWKAAGFGTKTG
jgi:rhodanese-related sulfurtransferase